MRLESIIDPILDKILINKALLSSQIVNLILNDYPSLKKNSVKSFVNRSKKLIRSENKYGHCEYAYILKKYKNKKDDLFNRMFDEHNSKIKFILDFLKVNGRFLSIHTFSKILCIDSYEEIEQKLSVLKSFHKTICWDNQYIYNGFEKPLFSSWFGKEQLCRLLACKILLYKHSNNNFIRIDKTQYLGVDNEVLYIPNSLYGVRFDAYTNKNALTVNSGINTFVVYDFAFGDIYSAHECKSFINRVMRLKNSGKLKKPNVFPIVIYKDIDVEALNLIRKNAMLGISYSSFLTSNYKDVLQRVVTIFNNKTNISKSDFEQIIINSSQIGIFENIKGYLFEYICYKLLQEILPDYKIDRNVKLNKDNKLIAQFDVIAENSDEKIYCECKAVGFVITFGKKKNNKIRRNTVLYTIEKIKMDTTEKKKRLLYFTTSSYQKIDDNSKNIINSYKPEHAHFANATNLLSFYEIKTIIPNSFWIRLWNTYFNKE